MNRGAYFDGHGHSFDKGQTVRKILRTSVNRGLGNKWVFKYLCRQ